MILTAHQPAYLPWLGLFHKIAISDVYVFLDLVQYQPEEFNNRNKIKTASGPIWLTVPVQRQGYMSRPISQIEIDNRGPWAKKHWRSLEQSYARAPFFDLYAQQIEAFYGHEWTNLVELNWQMLRWFVDVLGIRTQMIRQSESDFIGRKSDLIFDICTKLGASAHVFGAQGRDYVDEELFAHSGIRAIYQEYRHPVYPQRHGDFVGHLSIVDLLFNCGKESLDILMSGNTSRNEIDVVESESSVQA